MKEFKDITAEELTAYRAIYSVSCGTYAANGQDKPDVTSGAYKARKKEWNQAKAVVLHFVHDAKKVHGTACKPFAKVKPSGSHMAGERFEPLPGSILFDSMEAERLALMTEARAVLMSGTRADGIIYAYGDNEKLDSYVIRAARQDGMIREPLPSHPVQATILSVNENGEHKADRPAAIRWLAWRNASIAYYMEEARKLVLASMATGDAAIVKAFNDGMDKQTLVPRGLTKNKKKAVA